ncbi:hypothetical protein PoB_007331100 [Plakobranchus ocellatus]|uniref:Uncharacterized protein n=1 Tax=Plakobranchus ocellatus TaxID=259542 RepID=A0AAV4DRQ7_9GAST|nr:hypothetical protein PoB_007331100 [Plakobranchus ocellatus]
MKNGSAFLLMATEAAPRAASVEGFFATSGCGEGSERSTPPPIRVAPNGKQGAHTVWVALSIIPSTGGLWWIEIEDSMRRSGLTVAQERKWGDRKDTEHGGCVYGAAWKYSQGSKEAAEIGTRCSCKPANILCKGITDDDKRRIF